MVYEEAKFVPDQLGLARKVLYVAAEDLREAEVLIKSSARLAFALKDVAKTWTQSDLASAVEHDLRVCDIGMWHALLMEVVDGAEYRSGQVFQSGLWQGPNRLNQVVQAAISCEVADHGDAPLRTIPELVEDPDVLLRGAVALPVRDPAFQDFADLAVADGHLLDAVDLERGPVKHFLDGA